MFNKFILTFIGICIFSVSFSQKRPLEHSDYVKWRVAKNIIISNDGNWVAYQGVSQKPGLDGYLYLYNVKKNNLDSFDRGYKASFSPNSNFIVFHIQPQYDTVRQMKLDKVKKDKLPKDSLGIFVFSTKSLKKFSDVNKYQLAEEKSDWMLIYFEKEKIEEPEKDTTLSETQQAAIKDSIKLLKKQLNTSLLLFNPTDEFSKEFLHVEAFDLNKYGNFVAIQSKYKDSVETSALQIFDIEKRELQTVMEGEMEFKNISLDHSGKQLAYLMSDDTLKKKTFDLYLWEKGKSKALVDLNDENLPEGYAVSENGKIRFSDDDTKLFFGIAEKPVQDEEDTLLKEEKYSVDIWNWQDKMLQTEQNVRLKRDLKDTYLSVYLLDKNNWGQIEDENISRVQLIDKGNGNLVLGFDKEKYEKSYSWSSRRSFDVWLINFSKNTKTKILENKHSTIQMSPDGKYIVWFEGADSCWYSYKVSNGVLFNLTKEIGLNFYNEDHSVPTDPNPYGLVGWLEGGKYILINDRFDIWKINLENKEKPICLTNNYGRNNNIVFRYQKLDRENQYIGSDEKMILSAFDKITKKAGYFEIYANKADNPVQLIFDNHSYSNLVKAKNADKLIWRKESFKEYPDIYLSENDFSSIKRISCLNPQQKDFLWGSVEMVNWTSLDGKNLSGLLYKPEDFDPSKKYPVIIYFYEKYSDLLNRYYAPKPSHSVISFSYYTSNGYIVFIPDIEYTFGYPGQSAYDAIISGTLKIMEYNFVDKDKIGLQGQSWGGYQVAYLVTQTDMFAAAMAGAPVSNMTSAYGGIRWGTGINRMFQYEEGQSRIGATLWERRDLYIENSPLFFADKVETPLLIMHNDHDGAVPWYQGIEYFVALRRLNKPVWMLTYNNEQHNLVKWPNRMDLSIRMKQFFDYYLKDEPMPLWMKEGIPATKKGKVDGYELVK